MEAMHMGREAGRADSKRNKRGTVTFTDTKTRKLKLQSIVHRQITKRFDIKQDRRYDLKLLAHYNSTGSIG